MALIGTRAPRTGELIGADIDHPDFLTAVTVPMTNLGQAAKRQEQEH